MGDPISSDFQSARLYYDIGGLSEIKNAAKENREGALKEVSRQFEAILLRIVLKSMRDANKEFQSGLLDSNEMQFYQEMFDDQLTLSLAKDSGFGLSEVLYEQLNNITSSANQDINKKNENILDNRLIRPNEPGKLLSESDRSSLANRKTESAVPEFINSAFDTIKRGASKLRKFNSPDEFITEMLPIARKYAPMLGLDPKILVAQAALETGWGRAIMHSESGDNSHNLFGIKTHGWQGKAVESTTHEFSAGERIKQNDFFRGYDSYDESFSDYLQFLTTNPRYREALSHASDPQAFVKGLQEAGYATDPNYADKILKILQHDSLQFAE